MKWLLLVPLLQCALAQDSESSGSLVINLDPVETEFPDDTMFPSNMTTFDPSGTFDPTTTGPTESAAPSPAGREEVTVPTDAPTVGPTPAVAAPTKAPTRKPTTAPTKTPTRRPTGNPTRSPTRRPTRDPTRAPTRAPTRPPTAPPTSGATPAPSPSPTNFVATCFLCDDGPGQAGDPGRILRGRDGTITTCEGLDAILILEGDNCGFDGTINGIDVQAYCSCSGASYPEGCPGLCENGESVVDGGLNVG